ncbi:hypothetical protein [Amycolatopsis rifamycinica]|uniref:hypothetical protein n=1 Tax=Amycolatopsis rifamycinica TaxID=287986 RepID=UPI00068C5E52|nr:hypothetical protein [Amycolatopsis rifamycinica]
MVLAISFLEAPLKFRAPGVTLPLGLGIGRVVFAALNRVEVLFALALAACLVAGPRTTTAVVLGAAVVLVLLVQLVAVRPALTRRSDRVLAGETGPRSHAHLGYIGLEVLKVAALLAFGIVSL